MGLFPPARPHFDAALRDVQARSPGARTLAAHSLGAPPPGRETEAKEGLRRLADDMHAEVRVAALSALGALRDAGAIELVLARVEDGDPTVRQVALLAAGDIGGDRASQYMLEAVADPRPDVRFQAAGALAQLAPEGAAVALRRRARLEEDPEVRARLADALGALEDAGSADALAALLEDATAGVRQAAAIALARVGDARGARELVPALSDRERGFEAAWALGEIGAREAIEPIASLAARLTQPLPFRAALGAALVRLGDPRGALVLRKVLRAWRADGRSYAAELVGELGALELAGDLCELADRPRGADPIVVAAALGKLAARSPEARAALERMAARGGDAALAAKEALDVA